MARTTEGAPDGAPMNRFSWMAQKVIRDVDEWQRWIKTSSDNFVKEIKELQVRKDMPDEDKTNLHNLREQLETLSKQFGPVEKSIHKAQGRRIQRAKKRATP